MQLNDRHPLARMVLALQLLTATGTTNTTKNRALFAHAGATSTHRHIESLSTSNTPSISHRDFTPRHGLISTDIKISPKKFLTARNHPKPNPKAKTLTLAMSSSSKRRHSTSRSCTRFFPTFYRSKNLHIATQLINSSQRHPDCVQSLLVLSLHPAFRVELCMGPPFPRCNRQDQWFVHEPPHRPVVARLGDHIDPFLAGLIKKTEK
jgi:hypothetical protein